MRKLIISKLTGEVTTTDLDIKVLIHLKDVILISVGGASIQYNFAERGWRGIDEYVPPVPEYDNIKTIVEMVDGIEYANVVTKADAIDAHRKLIHSVQHVLLNGSDKSVLTSILGVKGVSETNDPVGRTRIND